MEKCEHGTFIAFSSNQNFPIELPTLCCQKIKYNSITIVYLC